MVALLKHDHNAIYSYRIPTFIYCKQCPFKLLSHLTFSETIVNSFFFAYFLERKFLCTPSWAPVVLNADEPREARYGGLLTRFLCCAVCPDCRFSICQFLFFYFENEIWYYYNNVYLGKVYVAITLNRAMLMFLFCDSFSFKEGILLIIEFLLKRL